MIHVVSVQPDIPFAWRGFSLVITNARGECGPEHPLTGNYFREIRFFSCLQLEPVEHDGGVHGHTWSGRVKRRSAYTSARLHPLAALATALAGITFLALLPAGRRAVEASRTRPEATR